MVVWGWSRATPMSGQKKTHPANWEVGCRFGELSGNLAPPRIDANGLPHREMGGWRRFGRGGSVHFQESTGKGDFGQIDKPIHVLTTSGSVGRCGIQSIRRRRKASQPKTAPICRMIWKRNGSVSVAPSEATQSLRDRGMPSQRW